MFPNKGTVIVSHCCLLTPFVDMAPMQPPRHLGISDTVLSELLWAVQNASAKKKQNVGLGTGGGASVSVMA